MCRAVKTGVAPAHTFPAGAEQSHTPPSRFSSHTVNWCPLSIQCHALHTVVLFMMVLLLKMAPKLSVAVLSGVLNVKRYMCQLEKPHSGLSYVLLAPTSVLMSQ